MITDDRLREIASSTLRLDEMGQAIRDLALAELDRRGAAKPSADSSAVARFQGQPIGARTVRQCPDGCGALLAEFNARGSGKTYLCDTEIGTFNYQPARLTAANWFHRCPNRKASR